MITISARLFGFVSLGTVHINIGVDLPVFDYKKTISVVEIELSTGPKSTPVPAHSVQMDKVTAADVQHEEPAAQLDPWS